MEFYDIITKLKNGTPYYIPSEIRNNINKLDNDLFLELKTQDKNCILSGIWEETIKLSENYIDLDKFHNIGIEKDELLEDIKAHVIFTIFSSLSCESIPGKSIKNHLSKIHNFKNANMIDKYQCNEFIEKLERVLDSIYNKMPYEGARTSDFIYFFSDSINILESEYIIKFDSNLLYLIMYNWSLCPYNKENLFGITFNKLSNFGKLLKISDENNLESCIDTYILERFFNISFLYKLSELIKNECKENLLDTANTLIVLSNLVSIPMIFSRNKYISIIYNSCMNKKNINIDIKGCNGNSLFKDMEIEIRDSINYLNCYMIPLLQNVYEYLVIRYFQENNINKIDYMRELLKKYLDSNSERFQFKDIILDISKLESLELAEAVQINITNLIYNFSFNSIEIDRDEKITDVIENIRHDTLSKYGFFMFNSYNYYNNFPQNLIYNNYQNRKKKK